MELKEMSIEELAAQLKADADKELYENIDEPKEENEEDKGDKEIVSKADEENRNQLNDDFSKFTKLIRRYKKIQTEIKELEMFNKDNVELQKYIKLLEKLDNISLDLDNARKGYLYESAIKVPNAELENSDVKLIVTFPYDKTDFDTKTFEKDYGPETEMYKKYMKTKSVKGNIKYKIKE